MSQPEALSETHDAPEPSLRSALFSKTLGLCRRLLVGNGWRLKDIRLEDEAFHEHHLPARLTLTCTPHFKISRRAGPPPAGADAVFHTAGDARLYHETQEQAFIDSGAWQEEAFMLLDSLPARGWGSTDLTLPLTTGTFQMHSVSTCDACRGEKTEICPTCLNQPASTAKPCKTCHGAGKVACVICAGTGCMTESVTVGFTAKGMFEPQVGPWPVPLRALLEKATPEELAQTHGAVTLAPEADNNGKTLAIDLQLTLPEAHYTLHLKDKSYAIEAYGNQPVLENFPTVLDDIFAPLVAQISATTLPIWLERVRLLRELAQALASGETLRTFYLRRYPYGLSPRLALQLAARVKDLFFEACLMPRLAATLGSLGLILVAYYVWLYNPRPDFLPLFVPIWVWDLGLMAIFTGSPFLAVSLASQHALQRFVGLPVDVRAAGGFWAVAASGLAFLACLVLLVLPDTRPEWLYALFS